jgi:hypothetical protein
MGFNSGFKGLISGDCVWINSVLSQDISMLHEQEHQISQTSIRRQKYSILSLYLNISLAHSPFIQTDWLFALSAFMVHKLNSFKSQIIKFLSKYLRTVHMYISMLWHDRNKHQNQDRTQYTEHGAWHFNCSDYVQIWQHCAPLKKSRTYNNYERSCQYVAMFHVRSPLIHLLLLLVF